MTKPHLASDWKHILKKAWSVRLIALAGLLQGLEMILPLFVHSMPRGVFASIAIPVTAAAFASRVMAQKGFDDGND
jgi:hypothetical protein